MRIVELAVDLKYRDLRHGLEQFLIADAIAQRIGASDQRLAVHVLIEHPRLDLAALRVADRTIGLPLDLRELLLVGLPDFVGRHFAAVHLGRIVGRAHGPVDAPKYEHQTDGAQHHAGQPTFQLVVYRLQHAPTLSYPKARPNGTRYAKEMAE